MNGDMLSYNLYMLCSGLLSAFIFTYYNKRFSISYHSNLFGGKRKVKHFFSVREDNWIWWLRKKAYFKYLYKLVQIGIPVWDRQKGSAQRKLGVSSEQDVGVIIYNSDWPMWRCDVTMNTTAWFINSMLIFRRIIVYDGNIYNTKSL